MQSLRGTQMFKSIVNPITSKYADRNVSITPKTKNRSLLTTMLICISTFTTSGCANKYFRVSPLMEHPSQMSETGSRNAYKEPINLKKEPYATLLADAQSTPTSPISQTSRNRLQNKIVELSDDICEQHKGDIVGTSSAVNLWTGLGATVFSGVSAIVTGAAAANYAASATILNGTRSAASAEVYQGLFTTAIIKAIEESRDQKKKEILAHQIKDTSQYPVEQAIVDAQDYHFRCSFYHGLVVLNEDAKKRATPSRAELLGRVAVLRKEKKLNNEMDTTDANKANISEMNNKIDLGIKAIYDRLNTID